MVIICASDSYKNRFKYVDSFARSLPCDFWQATTYQNDNTLAESPIC